MASFQNNTARAELAPWARAVLFRKRATLVVTAVARLATFTLLLKEK